MGDLIGAPAVHLNFPLLSFSLYTTFKKRIAAASEPTPLEYGRFGEWSKRQSSTVGQHSSGFFLVISQKPLDKNQFSPGPREALEEGQTANIKPVQTQNQHEKQH